MNRGARVLALGLLAAAALCVAPSYGQVNPCAPPNRCLGPNFPALVDINGDGRPTPGVDIPLVPVYDPQTKEIYVDNPWDSCSQQGKKRTILTLSDPQPLTGIPTMAKGEDVNRLVDTITATAFTAKNEPKSASFIAKNQSEDTTITQGTGTLLDANGDGIFEAAQGTRSFDLFGAPTGTATIPFIYADINGDGKPDYISIPWSQAALVSVDPGDNCGPGPGNSDPQIWVPLADSRIILDLNGDGAPDLGFFQSPPIAPLQVLPSNPVPTLSQWAMMGMALALTTAAWFALRNTGPGV